jgi:hypothetical protein
MQNGEGWYSVFVVVEAATAVATVSFLDDDDGEEEDDEFYLSPRYRFCHRTRGEYSMNI